MSWFEAIVDGLKFILEELLAPIYDWLADALEDGLFWMLIMLALSLVIILTMYFMGVSIP